MTKFNNYYLVVSLLILSYCAPKATKTASSGSYEEDLEPFRPKYELPKQVTTNAASGKEFNPVVIKDHDNAIVEQKMAEVREKNKNIRYTQGYRIQVYSGNSQDAAEKAKEGIYRIDPNLEPEVIYFTPNFKVKVGNYYDRVEAYETLVKIRQSFPQALLLPERVSIK